MLGIFFFFPLFLLISLAIWLEDGRPIFFRQKRVGMYGRDFDLLKFRTLGYKKGISHFALFLRKSALDELPQLINILKGQMSFVGPRPFVREELLNVANLHIRFKVLPGLTGVAQLFSSRSAPIEKKLRLDLWYIENRNMALDIRLILKSVYVSLKNKWDAK